MDIGARYDGRTVTQNGWTLTEFKRDINGKTFTFYRYINRKGIPDTVGVEAEHGVFGLLHTFYFSPFQGMFTLD